MQLRVAISILVVATIVVAGATYLASNSQNGATSLQAQPSCANASPISYSYPTPANKLPVILLQPGSTVEICVTYQASWIRPNVTYADIQSAFFPNGVYSLPTPQITNTVAIKNCTCTTSMVSHSFIIKTDPTSITPTINTTTVTVMYTITPMNNATGFYDGFGPADNVLIAVGPIQSQITPSDFPFARQQHPSGPIRAYYPLAVSLTGANVTYISPSSVTP
jgi:hypothetical protein